MDRRTFLKSTGAVLGVLSSGGLLAACGAGGEAAAIPEGQPTWNLINASYELLTGDAQRFAFGLTEIDNTPVEAEDVQVFTRDVDGEVLGGPYPVEAYGPTAVGLPLYRTEIDVPAAGVIEIVAVQGEDFGQSAMNAVAPEDSVVPVPGQEAISVATPTAEEDLGLEEVCTRPEDCSMHAVSLDTALAEGRPVVLMFATPAYCQTAVCGPSVDTLQEVADSRDWGDVAFIHAEVYEDAGETVADHIQAWNLPSEPWLFTIDREGAIAARLDGPMIAEELTAAAEAIA